MRGVGEGYSSPGRDRSGNFIIGGVGGFRNPGIEKHTIPRHGFQPKPDFIFVLIITVTARIVPSRLAAPSRRGIVTIRADELDLAIVLALAGNVFVEGYNEAAIVGAGDGDTKGTSEVFINIGINDLFSTPSYCSIYICYCSSYITCLLTNCNNKYLIRNEYY